MTSLSMNEFWHSWWGVGFAVIPFMIALIGVAMDMHTACSRNFEVVLTALQKSPAAIWCVETWGTRGLIPRTLVASALAGAIARPRYFLVRGLLDAEEVAEFPEYLRRRMKVSNFLSTIGFIVFISAAILMRFTKS